MAARLRWVGSTSGALALLACGAFIACVEQGGRRPAPLPSASGTPATRALAATTAKGTAAQPGKNVPAIKVDTVGYPTKWKKVAIFNVPPQGAVVKDDSGKTRYTFKAEDIADKGVDKASLDPTWQADFTALDAPGRYFIAVGDAKSDVFTIGSGLYEEALRASIKHFYFQRCRSKLEAPHAVWKGDQFTRAAACHVHEDVAWDYADYPTKKKKWSVEAGWHDAGNYEQYIPSTGPSAQAMLMVYEHHPELFKDGDGNLPESGNEIPDILDEAKWGITWVLGLQEPDTGAFRAREAVFDWSSGKPQDERKPHWISGVGSASTAKAVSVLAVAARVYEKWDPAFAARCERASRAGWAFLEKHPERILVDGKGSGQPLWDDAPNMQDTGARLIAAVEVWRSFRVPAALERAKALLNDPDTKPERFFNGAWANLSRWGLMGLALDERTPPELRAEAKARLLAAVESARGNVETLDGYRCASGVGDYYWGHNSNLMEKAHQMAIALKLDPSRTWLRQALRDQWHWIMGRNPNGYSMVTRVGKGPERMYHTEWGTPSPQGPAPGYLLGGPNFADMSFLSPNAPAKALLWDNDGPLRSGLPPHSLWHQEQSDLWDAGFVAEGQWTKGWWAVTEPDIYYNANLVLVAAEVQDE
jgi:endoglucanase